MNQGYSKHDIKVNQRPMIYVLMAIGILSTVFGIYIDNSVDSFYAEVFLFVSSAFVLLIALINKLFNRTNDAYKQKQTLLKIYNLGFTIICVFVFVLYFVSLDSYISMTLLERGSFVNLLVFFVFLIGFINVRKQKLTYNSSFIELNKKHYYLKVLKRIAFFFVVTIITWTIYYLIHAYETNLWFFSIISIGSTFLSFSLMYLFVSIYEKIHYDEALVEKNGMTRYVSRKAFLLMIITSSFTLLMTLQLMLTSGLFIHLYQMTIRLQWAISALETITLVSNFAFIVCTLIAYLIVYQSILKNNLRFPFYFVVFKIAIWIGFVVQLLNGLYLLNSKLRFIPIIDVMHISRIAMIINIASELSMIGSFVLYILIYLFAIKNRLPGKSLFLIRVILSVFPIVHIIIFRIVANQGQNALIDYISFSMIALAILYAISSVVTVLILHVLGKSRKEDNTETIV